MEPRQQGELTFQTLSSLYDSVNVLVHVNTSANMVSLSCVSSNNLE